MNPGGSGVILSTVERSRYFWAARLCEGKKVLDYGCGHGQGSFVLASKAQSVLGYDIDEKALDYARNKYQRFSKNLIFTHELDTGIFQLFDTVVALEVIEHLEDGNAFLQQVKSFLRPGGQLLLSTPNKHYTQAYRLKNPFHLKEYYPDELLRMLLDSGFWNIVQHGQDYPLSRLDMLSKVTPLPVKKLYRRIQRNWIKEFSDGDPVQLYQCWLGTSHP